MVGSCFAMSYLVSFLVLQSSCGGRELCILAVMLLLHIYESTYERTAYLVSLKSKAYVAVTLHDRWRSRSVTAA